MKAHIVLAHPEQQSFNGLLTATSSETLKSLGYETQVSDLYAMDFDPRERADHFADRKDPAVFHTQTEQRFNADKGSLPDVVQSEANALMACDLLVVHFPLWWFGPPAILKGWMDRVFAYGLMYKSQMRFDTGVCKCKRMIACVTTGASASSCSFNGLEGDTKLVLWPTLYPFRYLGFDVLEPEILHGIGGVSFMESGVGAESPLVTINKFWEQSLRDLSNRTYVAYNKDTDFDETKRLKPDVPSYSPFIRQNKDI